MADGEVQVELSIRNIQEVQRLNARIIAYMQPSGPLAAIVQKMVAQAHRYLVSIIHVLTGSYRASQRMYWEGGLEGMLFVDPGMVNPRNGQRPSEYSIYEEARGDGHDAYARTETEAMPRIMTDAQVEIVGAMYG